MKIVYANPSSERQISEDLSSKQKSRIRMSKLTEKHFIAAIVSLAWTTLLLASYNLEKLFFSELLVSSFIILCAVLPRIIQPRSNEWLEQ